MNFAELVDVSRRVASAPGRIDKAELLGGLLKRLDPDEIAIGVACLAGHLRQGRIGIGAAVLRAAARPPSPATPPSLFEGAGAHAVAPLTLQDVDSTFERLACVSGPGVTGARAGLLRELFGRATAEEHDFLLRLVRGELRQGALLGVMEDAVARASGLALDEIRRAAMRSGDLERVAVAALTDGLTGLERFQIRLFHPVLPMLAQPVADIAMALARLGTAAFEFKLDGARVQIHRNGDEVRVYSRQSNDVTAAVPELVEAVRALRLDDAILDGEAIALGAGGRPLPFQETMRRFGRQLDVARMRAELPLTLTLFDLLRLDGVDRTGEPARSRGAALRERAPRIAVPQLVTGDVAEATRFYEQAVGLGHEGVMAKALDAPYEAGGRGHAWLKVKAVHTLDLVVLAAEWGSGRRIHWLSNIHLGARDPATGGFVMLGKTFKGMTDAMLEWQTAEFQRLAVQSEGYMVRLRPELVVEVTFNDVQRSPRYPGGMALRLARVKAYRPDKRADEADTVETVRALMK